MNERLYAMLDEMADVLGIEFYYDDEYIYSGGKCIRKAYVFTSRYGNIIINENVLKDLCVYDTLGCCLEVIPRDETLPKKACLITKYIVNYVLSKYHII